MTHFSIIRNFAIVAMCFGIVTTFGPSKSTAGPLAVSGFAFDNGSGPDGGSWRGTVDVAGAAFGQTLTAKVDWAVFGPGAFQDYLDSQAIAQIDPSAANDFTYVYQIHSVTDANPGINVLTVGIDAIDARGAVAAPSFLATGAANEKSPITGGDNNTSMVWSFSGNTLAPGDTSSLLLFSSPNIPEWDFLTVASGIASPPVSPLVGSPSAILGEPVIPEPSTLILALACGLPLTAHRRSR